MAQRDWLACVALVTVLLVPLSCADRELQNPKAKARKPTGKVMAVSDKVRLLIIHVGEDGGVEPGMRFDVCRNDHWVCDMRIDKVEPDWSSAIYSPN